MAVLEQNEPRVDEIAFSIPYLENGVTRLGYSNLETGMMDTYRELVTASE